MATQLCSSCKKRKQLKQFPKGRKKNGTNSWCKICQSAARKKWAKTSAGKSSRLKSKYGIEIAKYDWMLKQQGHKCAVCRTTEPKGRNSVFVVDHEHSTGRVRGLLCSNCNLALGLMRDNILAIEEMARYLGK